MNPALLDAVRQVVALLTPPTRPTPYRYGAALGNLQLTKSYTAIQIRVPAGTRFWVVRNLDSVNALDYWFTKAPLPPVNSYGSILPGVFHTENTAPVTELLSLYPENASPTALFEVEVWEP